LVFSSGMNIFFSLPQCGANMPTLGIDSWQLGIAFCKLR
jgi:hypothetical protein